MADRTFSDSETISDYIREHPRLEYTLTSVHKLRLSDITSLRIDGDNNKLDVMAGRLYRFKVLGGDDVLRPSAADPSVLERVFDPALAQAILVLVADYAQD